MATDTNPPTAAAEREQRFRCSIVIPVFNKVEYTQKCLQALADHTPEDWYEVVIVDNASTDATPTLLASLEGDVTIITNEVNQGFSRACNQGARAALGEHLLFLNNDTEPMSGWLEPLVETLEREPDVGAVGAKLFFPDGTIQHAGVTVLEHQSEGLLGPFHHFAGNLDGVDVSARREYQAVTAAVMLVRREAFDAAGGYSDAYWNGFEDVDLCFAMAEQGWRIVYEPASRLFHHESASGPERHSRQQENLQLLNDRWQQRITADFLLTTEGVMRVHPDRAPVTVIVVALDTSSALLSRCIDAALPTLRGADELVLVLDGTVGRDDHSGYDKRAARDDRLRVMHHPAAEGFAAAANHAIQYSHGEHLVLLHPDAIVHGNWLDHLMSFAHHPKVGAVGPDPSVPGPGLSRREIAKLVQTHSGTGTDAETLDEYCLLIPRRSLAFTGLLDLNLGPANHGRDLSQRLMKLGYSLMTSRASFVERLGEQPPNAHPAANGRDIDESNQKFTEKQRATGSPATEAGPHDRSYLHGNGIPLPLRRHPVVGRSAAKYQTTVDMTTDNSAALILKRVRRGSTVLEMGPATGYMTRFMASELSCRVWGVEIDPVAAEQVRRHAEQVVVADLDEPSWSDQLAGREFDHILFADVLEHLRDPWDVLKRAARLLKPSGTVLTSIPNVGHNAVLMELFHGRFEYRRLGLLDSTHLRFFTPHTIEELLRSAGLIPVHRTSTFVHPIHTEFAQSYASLPAPVAEYLKTRLGGLTYQQITVSKRADSLQTEH